MLESTCCRSDLFSSFKPDTNTIQWLNWLDILDQQTSSQGFGGLSFESDLIFEENKQQEVLKLDLKTVESFVSKDLQDPSVKSGNMFARGLQTSGDKYPAMKFPEAMVAIAQAAKGWPLLSNKMQMHKCEKCSQEFCSPLNQRRHMRAIHRKPLNGDREDLKKKREQIAAFWDKLNSADAHEILSAKNLSLKDLSAGALLHAISAQLQQSNHLLPQGYIKVATALLELVQMKNSKMPITSADLFAILEDASEKNMLYGVTSSSMHRCIFDNDPSRVGLETKNVVASLGFLVEYKLVRAWMDEKDAEALRCQKALVEEEEAAQKRRVKLLERKKQRKLRLKECKNKERRSNDSAGCLQELKGDEFPHKGEVLLAVTQSCPLSTSGLETHSMETSQITNGEIEDSKFATDSLEAAQSFEFPDDAEESFLEFSDQFSSQNLDTNHDSVGKRDGGPATVFSSDGIGWKERRQDTTPNFQCHGRKAYGKDRKGHDHEYGGHRLIRASYGVPSFDNLNTRYGHYHEKMVTLKRQNVVGTGHTVWARKTPQTPTAVSQHRENGQRDASNSRDDCLGSVPVGQSERLENSDFCSEKSEKCLSRVSSLSSDSVSSESSVSISAKVVAEEFDPPESKTIPGCSPHPTVYGKRDVVANAALMIGSVSMPLEDLSPDSRIDYSCENNLISTFEIEGENLLENSACFCAAWERVDGPQPSCTSSLDDFVDHPRGGVSHPTSSRELNPATIKNGGPGVQNKSFVKVWRPVTPGEHKGSHFGVPSLTEGERLDATDTVSEQREDTDASTRSFYSHPHASLSVINDLNNKERKASLTSHQASYDVCIDVQRPLDASVSAYFADFLNFLAQRWSKAMASPDIVCHTELDDVDIDETV